MGVDFGSLYARVFAPVHNDLWFDKRYTDYWLAGGRGSTKSSFISLEIIAGMLADPLANAIIYRRVGATLKDSVYAQMLWAIDVLGLTPWFRSTKAPLEIIYRPTGQRILFRGTDDPMKSKSIKLTRGVFRFLWFEELAEFRGMEDVRSIKQSILRGVDRAAVFYSYNPPKSAQSWVNGEALTATPGRMVHKSTFLDVPPDWLGEAFVTEAKALETANPLAYKNEYLGEVTGSGGSVFENVQLRAITNDDINKLEWFYQGVDWGYFPDPFHWTRVAWDPRARVLYILDEFRANKLGNFESFEAVKSRLTEDELLTADSAEPKSIADWRAYGARIHPVVKGPGSVDYSMKWLAALSAIVIDPEKAPATAKEFTQYEYERNPAGEFIAGYVDANNHAIDAVRYATFPVWRRRGT